MTSRGLAKISLALAIVLLVGSIIGFVLTLTLNAFVLDKFNAYGEVPIPGSGTVHLPAGEATISFHTVTVGNVSGGGLPVPDLEVGFDPPAGVAQPQLTENYGVTTSVNNDVHIRVWVMQVPAEGDYTVTAKGQVNGFINPQLAFGHGGTSSSGSLVWIFVGLFVLGLIGTIAAPIWLARTRTSTLPAWQPMGEPLSPVATPTPAHLPADEAVKIEQLKTLAGLRDSGALTEAEFETEKRRILDGR
ncbi:MAG: SHOCT domain-containing protein [Mycobacterium sp.]|uniref:SHOCT domain-containing protein n=1 Tax=Mycobacterium sp. TaxID=1785 RepID=UPI003BB1C992